MSAPQRLPRPAPARVLACGAYLKNAACLLDGAEVAWSPQHGDLDAATAREALAASIDALLARSAGPVDAVAHDLHPDFPSTRLAIALARRLGVPAIPVQHHHAHVAAVQAELGLQTPVIGLALDGVGLGDDGRAWGGEVLRVRAGAQAHRWRRVGHLRPLPLPGGDAAAREPWRLVAAVLHEAGRGERIVPRLAPVVGAAAAGTIATMLERGLNCPPTTSAGRWFDAAAGALGLSVRQTADAQAAVALERRARAGLDANPDLAPPACGLDPLPMVAALLEVDPADRIAVDRAAAGFHLALADGLAQAAIEAARGPSARTDAVGDVVTGGGCFANALLRARIGERLRGAGLRMHAVDPRRCGDAGLALGQAWVAASAVAAGAC